MISKLINLKSLTPNEEILNEYILKNINDIIYMTIYELSEKTYTSVSTIVRYCQKLDVSGFKAFKIELTKAIAESEILGQENYSELSHNLAVEDSSFLETAQNVSNVTTFIVEQTQQLFSEESLKQSVELLLNAKNIYAIGVSDSYLRLQHFQIKLLKLGIQIQMIPLQPEQFYLAHFSGPDDLAILVSQGGQTAEILNDARLFHKNNTPILTITSNTTGYLAQVSSVTLPVPTVKENEKPHTQFAAQIAIEYVLNVLYSLVIKEMNIEILKNTPVSKLVSEKAFRED